MILPLVPLLTLIDIVISDLLNAWMVGHFPVNRKLYIGGRKGTQVTDVSSSIALALEKGQDLRHKVAAGQADIGRFYDSISTMKVAQWLLKAGCSEFIVAAMLYQQLLVGVSVVSRGHEHKLGRTDS